MLRQIIKYKFYLLKFGDIWIQFVAYFTYFEILMNYFHTNVHISEFSKKYVYFSSYFLGDLDLMRIIFFHISHWIRVSNKYFSKAVSFRKIFIWTPYSRNSHKSYIPPKIILVYLVLLSERKWKLCGPYVSHKYDLSWYVI